MNKGKKGYIGGQKNVQWSIWTRAQQGSITYNHSSAYLHQAGCETTMLNDHNTSLTNLEQSHLDAHYWVSVRAQHQLDYTRVARHTRDQWPFWKVTLTGQQTSVATSVAADQCGQCERGGLSHLPISNIVPPHFFSQHVLWHFCSKMWSASIFHCCCDLSVTSS